MSIFEKRYVEWMNLMDDCELRNELDSLKKEEIEDSFYKELSFGTGGLRGKLGVGTAKMNKYVVSRATRGLAKYIQEICYKNDWKVAIGYDTRFKSKEFAEVAANTLTSYGIKVFMYAEPVPTPCISFAVRELSCSFGIVITASHNPAEYNGYKVYNRQGCQITTETAKRIYEIIKEQDYFFNDYKEDKSLINIISDDILDSYINFVKQELVQPILNKDVNIVYTPLDGTGLKLVPRALKDVGFHNLILVKEQTMCDGSFLTCPNPNPEEKEALTLAIEYAKKYHSDIVLATDPDCDRVSIAIKNEDDYLIFSANELGCLLLDYICSRKKILPGSVFCKTIVTTDMAELIAQHYGLKIINTLTGFKFIGEQIGRLEKKGEKNLFLFGFEESCGFLKGTFVRDKDAVVTSLLICEMYAYYSSLNISLVQKMEQLYKKFGYCLNKQLSFEFDGAKGSKQISNIMNLFRYEVQDIGDNQILIKKDYMEGIENLPKSDVIKLYLDNKSSITIRPSGTEPKLKIYFSIICDEWEKANFIFEKYKKVMKSYIDDMTEEKK